MSNYKVGADILTYCTRCKMNLWHVIVAMVGLEAKRVQCKTCHSQHNYRPPKSAVRETKISRTVVKRGDQGQLATIAIKKEQIIIQPGELEKSQPEARAPRKTAADYSIETSSIVLEQNWNDALKNLSGKPAKEYSPQSSFLQNELINHPTFGRGVVQKVVNKNKIEVLFKGAVKTLIQGVQPVE